MADKGLNIADQCAARSIYLVVPPGCSGSSQMVPSDIAKTSSIAKSRILVEQVIRRMKTFRILSSEIPVLLIPHADYLLIVCSVLCNFMKPIMID